MSRLNVRLDKLEQLRGCDTLDMTAEEIKERVQAIRSKFDLPDSMDDMQVILDHSKEITAYLVENAGDTRDLVKTPQN